MYLRDGTLLARYPHVERMIGRNFKTGVNSPPDIVGVGPWDDASDQSDGWPDRLAAARALTHFPISYRDDDVSAALADWREQTRYLIAAAGLFVLCDTALLFLVVRKLSHGVEHVSWKSSVSTPRSTT